MIRLRCLQGPSFCMQTMGNCDQGYDRYLIGLAAHGELDLEINTCTMYVHELCTCPSTYSSIRVHSAPEPLHLVAWLGIGTTSADLIISKLLSPSLVAVVAGEK